MGGPEVDADEGHRWRETGLGFRVLLSWTRGGGRGLQMGAAPSVVCWINRRDGAGKRPQDRSDIDPDA